MRLTLTMRMVIAFALIILVIAAFVSVILFQLGRTGVASNSMKTAAKTQIACLGMKADLFNMRVWVLRTITDKNDAARESLKAGITAARESSQASDKGIPEELRDSYNNVTAAVQAYCANAEVFLGEATQGEWVEAQACIDNKLKADGATAATAFEKLLKASAALDDKSTRLYAKSQASMKICTYIAGILALIVAVIVSMWLLRSIRKPIQALAAAANTMSRCDFSTELAYSPVKDELGLMTNSFIEMKNNIRDHISRLIESMEIVAAGDLRERAIKDHSAIDPNNEITKISLAFDRLVGTLAELVRAVAHAGSSVTSSSQELSAGAEETGKAIQQVAQTVQEVAHGSQETTQHISAAQHNISQTALAIEGISRDIDEVAAYALKAAAKGTDGKQSADAAVSIIDHAAGSVQQTTQVVVSLGGKTQRIAEFINIITGIADQTNLLALNAAIEAARAGDAGRGFAVVAEEVRKLAEESNSAAGSITKLVRSIEEEMRTALEAMKQSNDEVTSGAKTVGQASMMLSEIVKGVDALTERVQGISAAAEEINASTGEVLHSMQSVAAVAEENAAASEEVSSATEEQTASMEEISANANALALLAQELQALVARFKV